MAAPNNSSIDGKQHSLLQGDRLSKELEAQRARALARAYVATQGCMNVSVTEMVMQRGSYTAAEAEELQVAMGGGMSIVRDNTLDVIRKRQLQSSSSSSSSSSSGGASKEAALKAKLVQQQESFRKGQAEKAAAATGQQGETPLPLAPGWQEVKEPGSDDVYYWHTTTGDTTWERPTAKAAETAPAPAAAAVATEAAATAKPEAAADDNGGLPPGWKEVKHAATGQTVYVHEATGTKRWDRPSSADDLSSDIAARAAQHAAQAKQEAAAARLAKQAGAGKRARPKEVDPLDPTGGRGGNWMGERMADSTAGGALWQQRPLPAPGQILQKQKQQRR